MKRNKGKPDVYEQVNFAATKTLPGTVIWKICKIHGKAIIKCGCWEHERETGE